MSKVEAGIGQIFQRIAAEPENPQADIMLTGGIDSGGSYRINKHCKSF